MDTSRLRKKLNVVKLFLQLQAVCIQHVKPIRPILGLQVTVCRHVGVHLITKYL